MKCNVWRSFTLHLFGTTNCGKLTRCEKLQVYDIWAFSCSWQNICGMKTQQIGITRRKLMTEQNTIKRRTMNAGPSTGIMPNPLPLLTYSIILVLGSHAGHAASSRQCLSDLNATVGPACELRGLQVTLDSQYDGGCGGTGRGTTITRQDPKLTTVIQIIYVVGNVFRIIPGTSYFRSSSRFPYLRVRLVSCTLHIYNNIKNK